jgi:hypothetical protein
MGYFMANGMYADTDPVTFLQAGGVISASGSSAVLEVGDRGTARITANFSAVAGTGPTLDIAVMTCDTPGGSFRQVGTFTQFTATGSQRKSFAGLDRFVRLDYTLGGSASPSFTGTIDGECV